MSTYRFQRMPSTFRQGASAILLALILSIAGSTWSAPPKKAAISTLDAATIRALYMDGDFDIAIDMIETSLRTRSGFSREDSVFMFKHLGVMYAAKYETREKGKRFMLRLLEVEPTARILDMYASDMIYMIFKNIQDEFEASRRRPTRADSTLGGGPGAGPRENPTPQALRKDRKSSTGLVWIGATVAVAAAAGTWYFLAYETEAETKIHRPY